MTKLKYIIIGFVNLISLFACEKQPFDYRNKFVGDYEVIEQITLIIIDSCTVTTKTILNTYNGKIKKDTANTDLIITYNNKEMKTIATTNPNRFRVVSSTSTEVIGYSAIFSIDNKKFKLDYGTNDPNLGNPAVGCHTRINKTIATTGIKK